MTHPAADTADTAGGQSGSLTPPDNAGQQPHATCGVRYGALNWVGEFRLPPQVKIVPGMKVVVQSERGIELGEPLCLTCAGCRPSVGREQIRRYVESSGPEFFRANAGRILRPASAQDINEHARLNGHNREDIARCRELARQLNLDMKVVTVEHLLGGERIVFYFRSEGRVDFRELVRALARHYQTRIEMRQVGARDEARLIADYEVCGRECCCKNFLKKLRPVTMRMAKLQKSTLDPSKVSGRCGRLRCCLRYEHEGYDELARRLPRVGARVQTALGPAAVVDRQVLTQLVLVCTDDGQTTAFPVDEITVLNAARQPEETAAAAEHETEESCPAGEMGLPEQLRAGQPRRPEEMRQQRQTDDAAAPPPPQPQAGQERPAAAGAPQAQGDQRADDRMPLRRRRRRRRPRGDRPGAVPGAGAQ